MDGGAARTTELIAEGRYYEALGVDSQTTRLDIDIASARLSQSFPELAGSLSSIAQVITDPEKKEIYAIACELRDSIRRVLTERFGGDFIRNIQGCISAIWYECQELLRCDFAKGDVKMHPRGAVSISNRGLEWIIESICNRYLTVIARNTSEKGNSQVIRIVTILTCAKCDNSRQIPCSNCNGSGKIDSPADDAIIAFVDNVQEAERYTPATLCNQCGGRGHIPCDCQDTYVFDVPRNALPGSVIIGRGNRTRKSCYGILDHTVVAPRPNHALYSFYRAQQSGWGLDWTLEEAESQMKTVSVIMLIGSILFTALIGKFVGSWQTGGIIGAFPHLLLLVKIRYYLFSQRKWDRLIWLVLSTTGILILGAMTGHLLSTWRTGIILAGIVSAAYICVLVSAPGVERRIV